MGRIVPPSPCGAVGNKGQALRAREKSHKGNVWQDEQDEAYRQREDNDIPGWDPTGPLAPEEGQRPYSRVSTGSFENRLALHCIGLSTVLYTAAFNFTCWFSGPVSSKLSAIAIAQHMIIYLFRSWLIEQDYTMRLTVKKI